MSAEVILLKKEIEQLKAENSSMLKKHQNELSVYKSIFDNKFLSMVLLDRNKKVIAFNKLSNDWAKVALGKEYHINQSFNDFLLEEERGLFDEKFSKALNGEIIFSLKCFKYFDNEEHWFKIQYLPVFDANDIVDRICLSTVNATLEKKLEGENLIAKNENNLLKTQKDSLQIQLTQKDEFVNILAHDIKSPFNAIVGFLDLIKEDFFQSTREELSSKLELVINSAHNTLGLLENMLNWSRSQLGTIEFKPRRINLYKLWLEVYDNHKLTSILKGIKVVCEIDKNQNANCDKDMMRFVIQNLFVNAIKFSKTEGIVKIKAEEQNDEIIVSISDIGVGIKKQDIYKLFDSNILYTTRGTANEKGTGLGLKISKKFVEIHKGKIWVESVPDKGSSFFFTLPIN